MILLRNSRGQELYVADDREAEYLEKGCVPAIEVPPAPPLPAKKPAPKKKGTTKK